MSDEIGDLIKGVKAKEFRSLARLLTVIEKRGSELLSYPELSEPAQTCVRIGITGPPGAGKSTLIGELISKFRAQKMSVGVIAVDPSSPLSQGAILGDRIRYADHFLDDQVFVRSLGTRGSLGGLSASAYLMLRAYDIYGFDVVLIETVGVGQTELEVVHVADLVSVVLVPESGDSVQAMKAGLLEIADLYILNKSDRPGADALLNEVKLNAEQSLFRKNQKFETRTFKTIATEAKGVDELAEYYLNFKNKVNLKEVRNSIPALKNEARALLSRGMIDQIDTRLEKISNKQDFLNLFKSN